MTESLVIAVPSKGRIMEETHEFFRAIGTPVRRLRNDREYVGQMANMPHVEVRFMSSSEIASALHAGAIHLGVTGEDLLREHAPKPEVFDESIVLIKALGFGFADLVVAVPNAWIDVRNMPDLEDVTHDFRARHHRPLRIATKYLSLTRAFFADRGISDYRIVESTGATEGAPAAGLAEAIVDITTTGATLAANNLRVLDDGTLLKSEVQLAAARNAPWTDTCRQALEKILDRVSAHEMAETYHIVRFRHVVEKRRLQQSLTNVEGVRIIGIGADGGEILCMNDQVDTVIRALRTTGSSDLTVSRAQYIFTGANPLFDRVAGKLQAADAGLDTPRSRDKA